MNAFPGFRVLDCTVLNDDDDYDDAHDEIIDGKRCGGGGRGALTRTYEGHRDDGGWVLMRNSYASSNGRVVQFLTQESLSGQQQRSFDSTEGTRTTTTTMHARVEALFSHRRYGVDNTGNVRVWDAEGTLAGFLLSVILDDGECNDDVVVRNVDDDVGESEVVYGERTASTSTAINILRLKNVLRSLLIRRHLLSLSSSSSYAGGGDDDSSPTDLCNVLELGASQAGLAGLAMVSNAATTWKTRGITTMRTLRMVLTNGHPRCVENNGVCARIIEIPETRGITTMRPLCVVLADGYPRCVENNGVCARMISSPRGRGGGGGVDDNASTRVRVEVDTLLWDTGPDGAEACRRINALVNNLLPSSTMAEDADDDERNVEGEVGPYHLCLASDCVHFQDFHDGLLTAIARVLVVNGVALLCQPRRCTSLSDFMALVDAVNAGGGSVVGAVEDESPEPLFRMTLHENFHPKVSKMHRSLLLAMEGDVVMRKGVPSSSLSATYDPNWHLPLLLVLQKLRPYDEDVDGERARRSAKTREQ